MGLLGALLIISSSAHASSTLTPHQTLIIRHQVKEYFSPENDGSLQELEALRPRFDILQTVLQAARAEYEPMANEPQITLRAEKLLAMVARRAKDTRVPLGLDLRDDLKIALQFFLRRFRGNGVGGEAVLFLFDRWQMWSPEDLWLFLNLRDTIALSAHASRLRVLMPRLSQPEMANLAGVLRAMRPKNVFQHVLLLETGHMRESELVTLFSLTSIQFARALGRREMFDDESYMAFALENPVQRSITRAMNDLQNRLKERDPLVGSAFDKAVESAGQAAGQGYSVDDRILFFKLLQEGRLDWSSRASWLEQAKEISKQDIPLRERYRVEGSVILVQFKVKSDCEGKLDP